MIQLRQILITCHTYEVFINGFVLWISQSQAIISDQNGRFEGQRNGRCIFASLGNGKQWKIEHCFCSQNIRRLFLYKTISLFTT